MLDLRGTTKRLAFMRSDTRRVKDEQARLSGDHPAGTEHGIFFTARGDLAESLKTKAESGFKRENVHIHPHLSVRARLRAFGAPDAAQRASTCQSLRSDTWLFLGTLQPACSDSSTTVLIFPITTRSRRAMASQADAVREGARSAGEPAVPRLCAAERGCLLGEFLLQIFLRHRRTAERAEVEGAEDICCLCGGLILLKLR